MDPAPAPRTLPRSLQAVLCLWLILGLSLVVRTALRPSTHTCFPVLAGGAIHWWADEPLYANYRPALDYFRYPPVFAVLLTPLAWLGLTAGGIAWNTINLAVLAAGLWRFRRDVLPAAWSPARQAVFLVLATLGGLRALWNGQCNALVAGLVLFGVAAVVRGRWWPAAGWLAGSVLVKLTPLPVVLLLALLWPRQLVARLALVLALGGLLPFLTRPADRVVDQYAGMIAQMRETAGERWPGFRDAWTVWLVGRSLVDGAGGRPSLLEPLDSRAYRVVQLLTAGTAAAMALACRRRQRSTARLVLVTLGLGCAWTLLFGPAVEHPTYVFLAPSLACAVVEPDFARGRKLILPSAVLILALGWGSLTRPWQDNLPLLLITLPTGTGLFTLWLVYDAFRGASFQLAGSAQASWKLALDGPVRTTSRAPTNGTAPAAGRW